MEWALLIAVEPRPLAAQAIRGEQTLPANKKGMRKAKGEHRMNLGKCDGKVRDLLTKAKKQGFILERDKKSYKLIPPDKTKPIIVISSTPSDGNYYWELRRQLKASGYIE